MFKSILLLISISISYCNSAPLSFQKRNSRWDYNSEKLYGVNLGGWLVLEPYITPSIFESVTDSTTGTTPIDEWHLCETLGTDSATTLLQSHYESWFTEDDFEKMSSVGLNFVRIPIGYWAFQKVDGDPYVMGQVQYLDKALSWCSKHGLKAWIDLHGVPGSQNGFDNSGDRDVINWQSTNEDYVSITIDILTTIAAKYSADEYDDVVIGIELVNEPLGSSLDLTELSNFYLAGYQTVRDSGDVPVIIHDAFQSDNYWDSTLNTDLNSDYWDVVVDHHHYQVFSTGELQRSIDEHISVACAWGSSETNEYHWNVCGEWTAALTDCAKWLNGVGRGARYDSTYLGGEYVGSCDELYLLDYDYFTTDVIANYRKYVEAQMDAMLNGKVAGWVFWCWKTENNIEWDFQRLLDLGVIPQPFDDRLYPNQCGY
ncbi:glycoside hydrolase family 5 protein [[Candida] arabinofermentans NRRL YB-2248]|uniref:Glucan 1,3-beta-glucosidase n=1 Tax=[Candida] arabinofermentans NRRL YB-2248 TaxID=983967 RepID=A0A1E4STI6_9ASCO|nr:glycoside hydrolase family 5 protein [[Candida] arabinofermentans NRRL YB-2248]